jgi:L-alanine-DL-glutamate epimerase-like enolase superfamily enzyme
MKTNSHTIRITYASAAYEQEKLIRPLGLKGNYLTELWQVVSRLQSESGNRKTGLATQSVLYGDADLFGRQPEEEANDMMFALTRKAMDIVKETSFLTPVDLLEQILPEIKKESVKMTNKKDLNINYVYNALVSIDHAAWLLYAADHGISNMDDMIPPSFRQSLGHHNNRIAIMYQVSYGMPVEDIQSAADQGFFVFKIKTGSPGTQTRMLENDMNRLTEIHRALEGKRTNHTAHGKIVYTMDANARYEKKETLLRYLDHAKKIGAFDQILLYEEPLSEENEEDVRDAGVRIAGDESVHDEAGAERRLQQGYSAIVLKGIAKTLSLSMKIARLAHERNIPCLCSDLTVNPILVDWHKNLAGRLAPFPGINMGLMETNGDTNYANWNRMRSYHPLAGAAWTQAREGVFELDKDFYERSGGIFEPSLHYDTL